MAEDKNNKPEPDEELNVDFGNLDTDSDTDTNSPINSEQPADAEKKPTASRGFFGSSSSATIAQLKKELAEANDKTLRTFAELENYRKRAARTLQEELKFANMSLIRDFLPVIDNLERAIEAAQKQSEQNELSPQGQALLQGVEMVVKQFNDVLAKHDCTIIEAMNQPFDPNFHQAITQMPSADVEPNTVIMETQKGYLLHDRVVRPTQVIVSTKPAQ